MIYTIQDEERAMRVHMEALKREAEEQGLAEGLERGLQQGLEQGRLNSLFELVRDGMLDVAFAAERAGMGVEEFTERAAHDGFAIG